MIQKFLDTLIYKVNNVKPEHQVGKKEKHVKLRKQQYRARKQQYRARLCAWLCTVAKVYEQNSPSMLICVHFS